MSRPDVEGKCIKRLLLFDYRFVCLVIYNGTKNFHIDFGFAKFDMVHIASLLHLFYIVFIICSGYIHN